MKKVIWLSAVFIITVFISGCITSNQPSTSATSGNTISGMIPMANLPSGLTFVAVHDVNVDIGNSPKKAIEGIYRTPQNEEMYIQVFSNYSPDALISEYKAQFNNVSYEPFKDVYFNGHNATEVLSYSMNSGKSVEKYSIIWKNNNVVIKVGPSVDIQVVRNLASVTNS